MIYLTLFLTFFKIGLFTFGGGYAMLPLIQADVLSHQWMASEELVNFIAVSESTPGPFAINISTFVGTTLAGVPGAICSTLGVILPSFIIILIVARFYEKFKDSFAVKGCMSGLKPAVIGLIGSALISVAKTVFDVSTSLLVTPAFYISLILCIGCSVLAFKKVHPIWIICLSAIIGMAAGFAGWLPF